MSALLESPVQPFGFHAKPVPSQPLSTGVSAVQTGGIPSIFGETGFGPAHDSSRPMGAFGQAPLRRPLQPIAPNGPMNPAFRSPSAMDFEQPPGPTAWTTPTPAETDPAFRGSGPLAQALMPAPQNPPTTSMGGVSASALINTLQQQMPAAEHDGASLDTLRMQMFGNYYQEIEGKMGELRSSMTGEMARSRRTLMERMDELGAGLHRDMVAMRQEMQKELEDLKRDVFSAVMSISALNDKLGLTDSRFRETWMAVTKALTDRIDNQATGLAASMKGLEAKVDQAVDERVEGLVETAMLRQISNWSARHAAANAAAA